MVLRQSMGRRYGATGLSVKCEIASVMHMPITELHQTSSGYILSLSGLSLWTPLCGHCKSLHFRPQQSSLMPSFRSQWRLSSTSQLPTLISPRHISLYIDNEETVQSSSDVLVLSFVLQLLIKPIDSVMPSHLISNAWIVPASYCCKCDFCLTAATMRCPAVSAFKLAISLSANALRIPYSNMLLFSIAELFLTPPHDSSDAGWRQHLQVLSSSNVTATFRAACSV